MDNDKDICFKTPGSATYIKLLLTWGVQCVYAEAVKQSIIHASCGNWNLGSLRLHMMAFQELYSKHWSCSCWVCWSCSAVPI